MKQNTPPASSWPELVIFDLDGTLVDTAPDLLRALNVALDTVSQAPIELTTIRAFVGKGARAMIERALRHNGEDPATFDIDEMFDRFLTTYNENICVDSRPFPGVLEALAVLESNDCTMAVCTNKRQGLAENLLEALGMTARFSVIVGADTVDRPKPDRDHIDQTIRRSGLKGPIRSVMIGDSATDLNAAKAGQIPCLLHEWGYSDTPISLLDADGIFGDFASLPQRIQALFNSQDQSAG